MRTVRYLLSLSLILVAASCGPAAGPDLDEGLLGGNDTAEMAGLDAPMDGLQAADGVACTGTCKTLQQRYGVRPRIYDGFFNCSLIAEKEFLSLLAEVVAFQNDRLATLGYADLDVTPAELATNFITEGGYYLLDANYMVFINGFDHVGIDTLVDRYEQLKAWLPASVRAKAEDPNYHDIRTNELGQTVVSLDALTFSEALHANAAMFTSMKARLSRDLANKGITLSAQPRTGQMFWTTLYFNAGEGTGKRYLTKQGFAYYKQAWTKADNPERYNRYAQYNALWRTASYEYMATKTLIAGIPACTTDCMLLDTHESNDYYYPLMPTNEFNDEEAALITPSLLGHYGDKDIFRFAYQGDRFNDQHRLQVWFPDMDLDASYQVRTEINCYDTPAYVSCTNGQPAGFPVIYNTACHNNLSPYQDDTARLEAICRNSYANRFEVIVEITSDRQSSTCQPYHILVWRD